MYQFCPSVATAVVVGYMYQFYPSMATAVVDGFVRKAVYFLMPTGHQRNEKNNEFIDAVFDKPFLVL